MGLLDPITVEYSEKWGYFCQRGRETFYNDQNEWITFETEAEAIKFREKLLKPKQQYHLGVKTSE
jgi:hypothetical protein